MTAGQTQPNTTHDYTQRGWGHDFAVLAVMDGGQTLRASGWGRGLEVGHFLILANKGSTTRYRITEIEYRRDPDDMWAATLAFDPRSGDRSDTQPNIAREGTTRIPTLPPDSGIEVVTEQSGWDRTITIRVTITHAALMRAVHNTKMPQSLLRKTTDSRLATPMDMLAFAQWVVMANMGGIEGVDIGDTSEGPRVREAGVPTA